MCIKSCGQFINGQQLADDIFQNTILKALKGIHGLRQRMTDSSTNNSNYIKAWLSRIARNELIDFLRKNPDEKRLANEFRINSEELEISYDINEDDNEDIERPSIEKEQLDKALSSLTERERDILMTYFLYQYKDNPNGHLPDTVIENLCKKHGVKSDNLRQIKKRALMKLKKACELKIT